MPPPPTGPPTAGKETVTAATPSAGTDPVMPGRPETVDTSNPNDRSGGARSASPPMPPPGLAIGSGGAVPPAPPAGPTLSPPPSAPQTDTATTSGSESDVVTDEPGVMADEPGVMADEEVSFRFPTLLEPSSSPLRVPLMLLAGAAVVVVIANLALAAGLVRGLGSPSELSAFLQGFSVWTGMLAVLASGLIVVRPPASERVVLAVTVFGALVIGGGALGFLLSLRLSGPSDLIRIVFEGLTGAPGGAVMLGGLAIATARQTATGGKPPVELPVFGMLLVAGLQSLSGIASGSIGFFDFFGPGERLAIALGAFDLRPAALLLASAVLLLLSPFPTGSLSRVVAIAAAGVASMSLFGALVFIVVGQSVGAQASGILSAPSTVAIAAVAAVLALLADQSTTSDSRPDSTTPDSVPTPPAS